MPPPSPQFFFWPPNNPAARPSCPEPEPSSLLELSAVNRKEQEGRAARQLPEGDPAPSDDQAKQDGQPGKGPQAGTQHTPRRSSKPGWCREVYKSHLRWVPMVGEWWSLLPRRAKGAAEASDGEG